VKRKGGTEAVSPLPESIRAFIAIRMSGAAETAIERFINDVRPLAPALRWVPRANFHVTLRFLGNNAPVTRLEALGDDLAKIAEAAGPFALVAQGAGAFPNLTRPRVIWIGLRGDSLIPIAEEVREACMHVGFGVDDHPYSPHLTIARVRDPKGLAPLRQAIEAASDHHFGESLIDSMALYHSVLGGPSPKYLELKRWPFGSA
jgi:2'-5' RNA ligase